ncbi:hypothetical protein BDV98DRAFT_189203 [Pterulicium gracile]|uniref:F-box domain-containing protein n=1 Tax=Pterulicium gracile TaxID=1884261 RepID=A0A5C3Q9Z1_9AGAR|nr:hypothetical protein BDV98DRAFT_189203 [Pterula gracilis]
MASILVFAVNSLIGQHPNGLENSLEHSYPHDATWSEYIRITMVCSTWRQIALHTPKFWTPLCFLLLVRSAHFPEILSRSGVAPLRLRITPSVLYSDSRAPPIPESRLAQLFDPARLLELNLYVDKCRRNILLESFPMGKTPLLEIFVLCKDMRVGGHLLEEYLAIPHHILNFPRPSIQNLLIELCHSPWESAASIPSYPNLVHRTLSQLAPTIYVVEVLRIINLSPKLEHLALFNDPTLLRQLHRPSLRPPDDPSLHADLPRLATLRLTGDSPFICGLLSKISHPPSTSLRLVCKGHWPAVNGLHPYTSLLDLVGLTTANPLYSASTVSLQKRGHSMASSAWY